MWTEMQAGIITVSNNEVLEATWVWVESEFHGVSQTTILIGRYLSSCKYEQFLVFSF